MKKYKILATLMLATVLCVPLAGCIRLDEEQYEIMKNNIVVSELSGLSPTAIDIKVNSILSEIKDDGSFESVSYDDTSQTNWMPIAHLDKLRTIARAYVLEESMYYGSNLAFDAVTMGLKCWLWKNPRSTNWYYASIGNPQRYAPTLIMIDSLDKKLDENLRKEILNYWKKTGDKPQKWTGANTVDIALHWLYRGVYTRNLTVVNNAITKAYAVIEVSDKEGIKPDNSYQQHGAQLYNLGYGNSILTAITTFAKVTACTNFALPSKKLKILSDFIINGYIPAFRGKYGMYNQDGRGLARINSIDKGSYANALKNMATLDVANAQIYRNAVDRMNGDKSIDYAIIDSNRYYYNSDYALQNNKEYNFDVKMVSSRTARTEWGNGENTKGYFLADGGYSLYKKGLEYYNVFPLWNWTMIPGTTAPQMAELPLSKEWQHKGVTSFTGGLSAGEYGIAAYSYYDSYQRVDTGANKGYFMLGDEIICLGSQIHSSNTANVFTTVNQVNYVGEYASNFNQINTGLNRTQIPQNGKIIHDGVGYINLSVTDMQVSAENRTGDWQNINHFAGSNIVTGRVFSLYYDHGKLPINADYAYAIVPKYSEGQGLQSSILANDNSKQFIYREDKGLYAGIFYAAGTFAHSNISIKVDKPCIVMIVNGKIYLSEPTQKIEKIKVRGMVNGNEVNYTAKFGGKKTSYGDVNIQKYR